MEVFSEYLIKDKFTNLDQLSEILKEEITPVAQNFFVLSGDLVVRFKREGDGYVFFVEIKAERVKPFGMRMI